MKNFNDYDLERLKDSLSVCKLNSGFIFEIVVQNLKDVSDRDCVSLLGNDDFASLNIEIRECLENLSRAISKIEAVNRRGCNVVKNSLSGLITLN